MSLGSGYDQTPDVLPFQPAISIRPQPAEYSGHVHSSSLTAIHLI